MIKIGNEIIKNIETRLVHGFKGYDKHTGAVSFPIYQSATFRHPGLNETTGYDYSRLQNPTREELENTVAILESGKYGFAFSTGMAAISTILYIFKPGDHLIISNDLYGGTYRLFEEIYKLYNIEFSYVDTSNLKEIKNSIKKNSTAFFIETPSNPMMKIANIKKISEISKNKGMLLIVDNTFLTPYFQKPLELGADIVVHSGTKFLGGHNDTLAGLIVLNNTKLAEKITLIQKSVGAVLSPFDSWLILRGIKTLGIRLEKQQANALKIANWLNEQNFVSKVYYVGLPQHENYNLAKTQATGFGSMISFSVSDINLIEKALKRLQIIIFAESLGGVETLITYPIVQTHASVPVEFREKIGLNDTLLRLSIGIESVEDLIADIEQAFT